MENNKTDWVMVAFVAIAGIAFLYTFCKWWYCF